MTEARLPYADARALLAELSDDPRLAVDAKAQALRGETPAGRFLDFRWPLPFPPAGEDATAAEYFPSVPAETPDYLIVLMQAGNAALGYVESDELLYHKVIRKYMVRKQQGKAQVKHLKTKGKSRLGSRIRLAQTNQFFEEINEKLRDWAVADNAERILYSASVTLWPLLFQAKAPAPFDQRDARLRKVPLDLRPPNLAELERVHAYARYGYLTYDPEILDLSDWLAARPAPDA